MIKNKNKKICTVCHYEQNKEKIMCVSDDSALIFKIFVWCSQILISLLNDTIQVWKLWKVQFSDISYARMCKE